MPTPTYTPLANITLGSAASSITFGSIPATYRDLIIVFVGTASATSEGRMRLNGDTGTNYSYQYMNGNGSTATGNAVSGNNFLRTGTNARATTTSALQMNINIMDYSATNKHKTTINRADATVSGTGAEAVAGRWANTAAVTSVTIFTSTGNWSIGTTVALYGIVA
jgi:hypothetical protein